MEEVELGKFVEAPGTENPPLRWYWVVGVLALIVAGLAFKVWVYAASPDWLVRVLGFLGF